MPVQPLTISAVSLACGLGAHLDDVRASLRAGRSGLSRWGEAQGLPFETWFGALPPGVERALPPALADRDTRQARVAWGTLAPMRASIEAAVGRYGADRVGVIVGTTTGGMGDTERRVEALRANGRFEDGYSLRRQHNAHATADLVADLLGLQGPVFVQSSACSSSAKVLGSAQRLIAAGLLDAAVVGGIDTACRYTLLGFHSLGILSGHRCRPLSVEREGINLGEAAAWLLVERPHVDVPARARLLAVGETSDAHHATQPRPCGSGLRAAVQEALDGAGLQPADLDLVNAHATGTPLNDAAECRAFAGWLPETVPVVGTKGWTGHTLGAAGAVEAVLAVMALEDGWLPGTLTQGASLPEGRGLCLPREPVSGPFRRALSTSAAFAGHNAAVLLEAP